MIMEEVLLVYQELLYKYKILYEYFKDYKIVKIIQKIHHY